MRVVVAVAWPHRWCTGMWYCWYGIDVPFDITASFLMVAEMSARAVGKHSILWAGRFQEAGQSKAEKMWKVEFDSDPTFA